MIRILSLFVFVFSLFISPSYAEELTIFGTIKNGTTGGVGKATSIRMLALQGAMLPLGEIGPQSGKFQFPKMNLPEGAPILLQIEYQGVNYNKMIPPVTQFRTSPQEVVVYETGATKAEVAVKSLMQVMREKKGIRVFKLFLIDNHSNPPKSYDSKLNPLEYSVAEGAEDVLAQIQQPGSKMAIPLATPPGSNGGKILDRAILPGVSEMQVSYLVPNSVETIDESLFIESENGKFPIFVKPMDMELKILSGQSMAKLDKDVPQGLSAYVLEEKSFGTKIKLQTIGGKALPTISNNTNPEIVNGSILTTWDLSLFSVIGFLGLLFTLSFIFVYKNTGKKE
ncbi:hypothetical protein P3G55_10765 [Leptospira sp. 96542]|nr:hypothetical protein [Leptospira sp. 96542]